MHVTGGYGASSEPRLLWLFANWLDMTIAELATEFEAPWRPLESCRTTRSEVRKPAREGHGLLPDQIGPDAECLIWEE